MKPKRTVVILGLWISGSAILRNLSQKGYRVYGITDDASHEGLHSKYGKKLICPDAEHDFSSWLAFMIDLGKKMPGKPVLLPTGDKYVVAIEKGIEDLLPYFRMLQSPRRLHTTLTSKISQVDLAKKQGFPVPEAMEIKNSNDIAAFYKKINGPIILKPEFSYAWHGEKAQAALDDAKILVARTENDAKKMYAMARHYSERLLAEEFIEGDDSNLFYFTGIIGKNDRVGGRLIGKKIRVVPPRKGSASFVQLVDIPRLEKQCTDFLCSIGYRGICGIEVKYDSEDKEYKLIEINPRYGLWEDIGIPVGIDLAKEAVDDLYGDALRPRRPKSFKQKWVALHRDFQVYPAYRKEENLSLYAWSKSLRGPIVVNDFPLFEDTPYAIHVALRYGRQFLAKMRNVAKDSDQPLAAVSK